MEHYPRTERHLWHKLLHFLGKIPTHQLATHGDHFLYLALGETDDGLPPLNPYGTVVYPPRATAERPIPFSTETEEYKGQLFNGDTYYTGEPTLELTPDQIQAIMNDNAGVTDGIE
jgi:hypothetical protein